MTSQNTRFFTLGRRTNTPPTENLKNTGTAPVISITQVHHDCETRQGKATA